MSLEMMYFIGIFIVVIFFIALKQELDVRNKDKKKFKE